MSTEEQQFDDDSQMGGPGAPTPVSALEVRIFQSNARAHTDTFKGVNGLTARDIKLVVEGGYNTVEAIAYTYVKPHTTT
jgi:DNA repair protein RAD51